MMMDSPSGRCRPTARVCILYFHTGENHTSNLAENGPRTEVISYFNVRRRDVGIFGQFQRNIEFFRILGENLFASRMVPFHMALLCQAAMGSRFLRLVLKRAGNSSDTI